MFWRRWRRVVGHTDKCEVWKEGLVRFYWFSFFLIKILCNSRAQQKRAYTEHFNLKPQLFKEVMFLLEHHDLSLSKYHLACWCFPITREHFHTKKISFQENPNVADHILRYQLSKFINKSNTLPLPKMYSTVQNTRLRNRKQTYGKCKQNLLVMCPT